MRKLIGPFSQLVTMASLPEKGPIKDGQLQIVHDAGIVVKEGNIESLGPYSAYIDRSLERIVIDKPSVCIPGLVDAHTHMCYAGSRSHEYAMKLEGQTYQQIAQEGGGIRFTVNQTRAASEHELLQGLLSRSETAMQRGITTCEIKSGYGLSVESELKMLRVIQKAKELHPTTFIPTCLAAHIAPGEFSSNSAYLQNMASELLPHVQRMGVNRVDAFVEKGAFSVEEARQYLQAAKKMGFDLVIHGDQFTPGGAMLAAELGALSVDHLEHLSCEDAEKLARAGVIPIVLPGASLGLAEPFAPARMLLDKNLALVIASDWNPGSAPMGDLLVQSAILGMKEKITMAETLAAITVRAARALKLNGVGTIMPGAWADLAIFPCRDFRDILYYQGAMKPAYVCKKGEIVHASRGSEAFSLC